MVLEQPLPDITGASSHGPAAHWSRRASLPTRVLQHPAAGQLRVPLMWVPGVIPRLWAAFSVHVQSPGLVPSCVPRATRHSTPCPSPVEHLGLRLGRGHLSVTAEKIWVFPSFGNSFGVPHPGMQYYMQYYMKYYTQYCSQYHDVGTGIPVLERLIRSIRSGFPQLSGTLCGSLGLLTDTNLSNTSQF